jgi:hypothetical protein
VPNCPWATDNDGLPLPQGLPTHAGNSILLGLMEMGKNGMGREGRSIIRQYIVVDMRGINV